MATQRVLVVGEALIDVVHDAEGITERVGGSPLNVAVGLARLGDPTALLSWFARDARGARIREHLEHSGVLIAEGSDGAERTSTAKAVARPHRSVEYEFDLHWDIPVPGGEAPALLHSGSIALFLEPGAQVVLDLLRTGRDRSLISLDPNIRPTIIGDRDAAVQRVETAVALADLVKMSDEDAAWLYPGRAPEDVVADLLGRGPTLAAVTLGGEGSLLGTASGICRVPAPETTVADTIGAGDSYMSGLLHGVLALGPVAPTDLAALTREQLEELGVFAARCAAITVSRNGADPPALADLG